MVGQQTEYDISCKLIRDIQYEFARLMLELALHSIWLANSKQRDVGVAANATAFVKSLSIAQTQTKSFAIKANELRTRP